MAVEVDSVIVDLEARIGQYRTNITEATKLYQGLRAEVERPFNDNGQTAAAARAKASAREVVQAEEQATQQVASTRKTRTATAKQADAEEAASAKAAAKAKADAAKLAAKEEAAAAKEAAAAVKAAEREKQAAIAASERAMAQAAAAEARFQAQQTRRAEARFYASGPQMFEARARELRALEAAQVAAAPIPARRPLDITSASLPRSAGWEGGQNPFQAAATAAGPAAPIAAAATTEQNVAGTAAAKERAMLEAEINDRAIAQLGLKAQIIAADKADAVVLQDQLFALQQFGRYRALGLDEAAAQARVDAELLAIEQKRVAAAAEQAALVEKQMRAQSGAIASKISGAGLLTGALVGGLGAAEISHLNDRYIELSNSLKVAGVSASEFDAVQQHLLTTANKNGTNINALADVFRSASLSAHDLGLSQKELLTLTDAASNSLRIQGVSTEQARGSLLSLGHALESPRVNAREFNSLALNMYPLLQAAAQGSDKFGGSVQKLREAIIAGNVSGADLAKWVIAGADALNNRANKATLTTAQGFTSLTNALVVYFGEADKAQGVSAALGSALQKLGENLDTLIPAIAAVGTALTVGYITRMAQAAIATQGLGAAILGAFGGPVGLAITAVTLAIAGTVIAANDASAAAKDAAQGLKDLQDKYGDAGKAAGAASSGVRNVGTDALGAIPHVNAFAGAVGNLADQLYRQARAARTAQIATLESQLQEVAKKRDDALAKTPEGEARNWNQIRSGDYLSMAGSILGSGVNATLNFLHGGYTDQDNRKAAADYNKQAGTIQAQIAKLSDLKSNPIGVGDLPEGAQSSGLSPKAAKRLATLEQNLAGYQKAAASASGSSLATLNKQIKDAQGRIENLKAGLPENAGIGGRAGPSAETLAKRAEAVRLKGIHEQEAYTSELKQAHDRELQAQVDLSNDAEKRADLERQRLRDALADQNHNDRLKGPKDPRLNDGVAGTGERTAAQTQALIDTNTRTANSRIDIIDRDERLRKAADERSIDDANVELRKQELEAQEGLADTLKQRRKIAQDLLDLEFRQRQKALETARDDEKATPAQREIARAQLAALPGQKALAQENLDRQNQGVGRAYADSFGNDRQQLIEGAEVKVLQDFNNGLDQTVSKALHLHGIFGDILNDLIDMAIKQALIKPIANGLFPASGGGAGGSGGAGVILGGIVSGVKGLLGIGGHANTSGLTLANTSIPGLGGLPSPDDLSAISGLPGFATGGSGRIGGNAGTDQNVLSLNGSPVARVGKGELLSINPSGVSPNTRASAPQMAGPTINQTIRYSGAVDIADKSYVQQIALAQHAATQQAITQSSQQTLAATPGYMQQNDKLK